MSHQSYDHEALWRKAKLFISRAMDDPESKSFDEQALWATLALEVLGTSALAKISPLLIAEPTEEGRNILAAMGIGEGDGKFTTVSVSTVFKRCKRAFPTFNVAHANEFAVARNEYLHGAGIGFGALTPDKWWQKSWKTASQLALGLKYSDSATCPACGADGLLEAEEVQNERSDGYFDPITGEHESWGAADALPDYFSCAACQLVLSELTLLEMAGLDESFEVQGDEFQAEAEGEYGND